MKSRLLRCRLVLCVSLAFSGLADSGSALAWSFAVCGDSRNDVKGVFPKIVDIVQRSDMEPLVHVGDLESPGGTAAWSSFREKLEPLKKPFVAVIGNHELRGARREEFVRFFGLPGTDYSLSYRDVRFFVLDTADGRLTDENLSWLDRELRLHPKGKDGISYLAVASHYPPTLPGLEPHGTRGPYEDQSRKLHEILVRNKVDLFLCGHEHLHFVTDWNAVKVIVTGGAGAPLVPLYGYGFYKVEVAEGKVLETFVPVAP